MASYDGKSIQCGVQPQSMSSDHGEFGYTVVHKDENWTRGPLEMKRLAVRNLQENDFSERIKEQIIGYIKYIHHPNVVRYVELLVVENNQAYDLKMESISFGSLQKLLDHRVDIPWSIAYSILQDVSAGIEYLHCEKGCKPAVYHGNLHLNNILLTRHFTAKVSDYGLNEAVGRMSADQDIKFMAPEMVLGSLSQLSELSDVYSFGLVLFCIITGKIDPYGGRNQTEIRQMFEAGTKIIKIVRKDIKPGCRDELRGMCINCIHHDPEERTCLSDIVEQLRRIGGTFSSDQKEEDIMKLKQAVKLEPQREPSNNYPVVSQQQNQLIDTTPRSISPSPVSFQSSSPDESQRETSNNLPVDSEQQNRVVDLIPSSVSLFPEAFQSLSLNESCAAQWVSTPTESSRIQSYADNRSFQDNRQIGGKHTTFNITDCPSVTIKQAVEPDGPAKDAVDYDRKTPTAEEQKLLDSTRRFEDDDFDIVTKLMGKEWKELARQFGLQEGEIDQVDFDNEKYGLKEKCHQLLLQWKERESCNATVGCLAKHLRKIGLLSRCVDKLSP